MTQPVLCRALDCGLNFIDTARGYTDSEAKIGRGLAHRRDDYYLASKTFVRDAAGMAREIELSRRNLQADVIDLYQIQAIGSRGELERVLAPGGAYEALAQVEMNAAVSSDLRAPSADEMEELAADKARWGVVSVAAAATVCLVPTGSAFRCYSCCRATSNGTTWPIGRSRVSPAWRSATATAPPAVSA